jgi:hypothetical protein
MNQIQRNQIFSLIFLMFIFLVTSCATQSRSIGLGGAIGAAGGALLGGIASPGKNGEMRTRNIIVGSAVGGMAGMVTASVLHESSESKAKESYQQGKKDASKNSTSQVSAGTPNLLNPSVETRWVEGRAIGNRYIEGHYEYIITSPTRWDTSDE